MIAAISGRVDLERSRYNLSKEQNWHENLEIQFFTEGSGTVLLNGKKYNVCKDNIVVVNSNILHYTSTDNHLVYTCIIISNEWCKKMNINYSSLCFFSLIESTKLKKIISELIRIYLNSQDILRTAKLNELLLRIMVELIENHCDLNTTPPLQSKAFEAVTSTIEFIHQSFQQKITLSQISKAVLIDKYSLCREFKKHTGQTIFEYINQYRSLKAIDYLSDGFTVTETASLCGFENLSFFTKTFKRYTGKYASFFKK